MSRASRSKKAPQRRVKPDTPMASANDLQVGGDHYKGQKILIEPWDYCMANQLDPMQFGIIKYTTRWPDKGGIQDLRKVQHYLQKYIEALENGLPVPHNPLADAAKYSGYLEGLLQKKRLEKQ